MTLFWILASVMVLAAIAVVIVPLKRNKSTNDIASTRASVDVHRHRAAELEEEYARGIIADESLEDARRDLKRELLRDADAEETAPTSPADAKWAIVGTAVLLPIAIVGLYLWFGSAGVLVKSNAAGAAAGPVAQQDEMHGVTQMVARLEQKLKESPADAEGWILLGRSYAYMQRYDAAARAFASASQLNPDDPRLLSDYAEVLAVVRNSRIDMEVMGLVQRALAIDPQTRKALWLAGLGRYQGGDRASAVSIWKRLRRQMSEDSPDRQTLDGYIAQAESELLKTEVVQTDSLRTDPPAASTDGVPGTITVHVALDPALARQTSADDTVFIFARAHEGPGMPLAIVRKQVRDLPLQVTLDDAQSMAPGMSISKFPRIVVAARISKRGDARPQAGDLEGLSRPLQTGSERIARVRIDRVVR